MAQNIATTERIDAMVDRLTPPFTSAGSTPRTRTVRPRGRA
jgi:hypothetical protein